MDKQALKTLTMRLLNEHLGAALVKRGAVQGAIDLVTMDLANDNEYDRSLMGFTDDQRHLILEGLTLVLANAQAEFAEAQAAAALYKKEGV